MSLGKIVLQKGKDKPLRRFHPWIFSGAVKDIKGSVNEGDLVQVDSYEGEVLGMGHFQKGSISVRMLTFENQAINLDFWVQKLSTAWVLRERLGLVNSQNTNCFRLVHGEGDGLPGLVLDYYDGTIVMQAHSIGMHMQREEIAEALKKILGNKLRGIYYKSEDTLPKVPGMEIKNGYLWGSKTSSVVKENGHLFGIDWEQGQKTGFFLDQRDNRLLLSRYCEGKSVLNTFCYTGGFSIYALAAGATRVHSIDSSAKAMAAVDANVNLNFAGKEIEHQSVCADVMKYSKEIKGEFDLVVLDPPAFAKHQNARHNAVQAYKRLNAEALRFIAKSGILFTFSCSQVVDKQLFYDTIRAAAIEAGRNVRVLHQLSQPADHPVNIFHPESEYLKGLVLFVE